MTIKGRVNSIREQYVSQRMPRGEYEVYLEFVHEHGRLIVWAGFIGFVILDIVSWLTYRYLDHVEAESLDFSGMMTIGGLLLVYSLASLSLKRRSPARRMFYYCWSAICSLWFITSFFVGDHYCSNDSGSYECILSPNFGYVFALFALSFQVDFRWVGLSFLVLQGPYITQLKEKLHPHTTATSSVSSVATRSVASNVVWWLSSYVLEHGRRRLYRAMNARQASLAEMQRTCDNLSLVLRYSCHELRNPLHCVTASVERAQCVIRDQYPHELERETGGAMLWQMPVDHNVWGQRLYWVKMIELCADKLLSFVSDLLDLELQTNRSAALSLVVEEFQHRTKGAVTAGGAPLNLKGTYEDVGSGGFTTTVAATRAADIDILAHDLLAPPLVAPSFSVTAGHSGDVTAHPSVLSNTTATTTTTTTAAVTDDVKRQTLDHVIEEGRQVNPDAALGTCAKLPQAFRMQGKGKASAIITDGQPLDGKPTVQSKARRIGLALIGFLFPMPEEDRYLAWVHTEHQALLFSCTLVFVFAMLWSTYVRQENYINGPVLYFIFTVALIARLTIWKRLRIRKWYFRVWSTTLGVLLITTAVLNQQYYCVHQPLFYQDPSCIQRNDTNLFITELVIFAFLNPVTAVYVMGVRIYLVTQYITRSTLDWGSYDKVRLLVNWLIVNGLFFMTLSFVWDWSQRQLFREVEAQETAAVQAEKAAKDLQSVVGYVGHRVRNPLQSMHLSLTKLNDLTTAKARLGNGGGGGGGGGYDGGGASAGSDSGAGTSGTGRNDEERTERSGSGSVTKQLQEQQQHDDDSELVAERETTLWLGRIWLAMDQIMSLSADVLDAEAIATRKASICFVPVQSGSFFNRLCTQYSSVNQNVQFTWSVDAAVPELVVLDAKRVSQVFGNAVTNCCKAIAKGQVEDEQTAASAGTLTAVRDKAIHIIITVEQVCVCSTGKASLCGNDQESSDRDSTTTATTTTNNNNTTTTTTTTTTTNSNNKGACSAGHVFENMEEGKGGQLIEQFAEKCAKGEVLPPAIYEALSKYEAQDSYVKLVINILDTGTGLVAPTMGNMQQTHCHTKSASSPSVPLALPPSLDMGLVRNNTPQSMTSSSADSDDRAVADCTNDEREGTGKPTTPPKSSSRWWWWGGQKSHTPAAAAITSTKTTTVMTGRRLTGPTNNSSEMGSQAGMGDKDDSGQSCSLSATNVESDMSTTKFWRSNGIGLDISKSLSELVGGTISLSNRTDGVVGAHFTFTLPVGVLSQKDYGGSDGVRDILDLLDSSNGGGGGGCGSGGGGAGLAYDGQHVYETAIQAVAQATAGAFDSQTPARRVLSVDDDEINQVISMYMLESLGYKTSLLHDGLEVLERYPGTTLDDHYDVVLMDINMQWSNGMDTCSELRDRGVKIPIVAMTGNVTDGYQDDFYSVGFSDILEKPYTTEVLRKCLGVFFVKADRDDDDDDADGGKEDGGDGAAAV